MKSAILIFTFLLQPYILEFKDTMLTATDTFIVMDYLSTRNFAQRAIPGQDAKNGNKNFFNIKGHRAIVDKVRLHIWINDDGSAKSK